MSKPSPVMPSKIATGIAVALLIGVPATAREIQTLDLAEGYSEENRLPYPVLDGAAVGAVQFGAVEWTPAPGRAVIYNLRNRQPRYTLSPAIDPGALLALSLRAEAQALGWTSAGGPAWKIDVSVENLSLFQRKSDFGPNMYFAMMDAASTIAGPEGTREVRHLVTNVYWRFNGGFGNKDEATEAVAGFLVDAAQELVTLLNRDVVHAPPRPEVAGALAGIGKDIEDRAAELRGVGYSGQRELIAPLFALLASQEAEDRRWPIVNALGFLGDENTPNQLVALSARAEEDERYFLLKALHYLDRADLAVRLDTSDDKAGRVLYDQIAAFAAKHRPTARPGAP